MPHPIRGGVPTDQSHGLVTLELKTDSGSVDTVFEFPVNPEDVSIDRPSRQTVTQTLTGTYQDHLGQGLMKVRVRGHTGWRQLKTQYNDGFAAYKALRDLLFQYDQEVAKGDPAKVHLRLLLDIPSGWEHFLVSKENATFMRSRSQPLLFRYELDFIVLLDQLHDPVVDPSPAFIIILPSTPPPAIIVTAGPNSAGPSTDKPQSDQPPGSDQDPPPRDRHDSDIVANGTGPTYDPEWFSTAELYDMGVTTIGALASYVYGLQGWNRPGLLWWVIAQYNKEYFVNATPSTKLPKSGQTGDSRSFNDNPIMLRVPRISGAAYEYDSDRYSSVNVQGSQLIGPVPTHEVTPPVIGLLPIAGGGLITTVADILSHLPSIGDAFNNFLDEGHRAFDPTFKNPNYDPLRTGDMGPQ